MRYEQEGIPTLVLAGKEYGSGSSRDWAAKGPRLLGVRAVLAESYERIHRSNLIGMGILPLQFRPGENAESLGLTGLETFDVEGIPALASSSARGSEAAVRVHANGSERAIRPIVRIDTPQEWRYFEHGGILPYVLRRLSSGAAGTA
jgi:aconitate hydratase